MKAPISDTHTGSRNGDRPEKARGTRLSFFGAMLALGHCTAVAGGPAPPQVDLTRGQFLASDRTLPPAADARWEIREIPDDWNRSQPGVGGIGWYRFTVELAAPPAEPAAVYVPRFWMNTTAFVNGVPLSSSDDLARPSASNWNRPRLLTVPPSLLHAGVNEIHIGVWAYANTRGGLYGAAFGPESVLKPQFDRRFFLKVTLNQALLASTLLMAGLIGLIWLRRRRDTIYGWFALSALAWDAKTALFLYRDPRIETWIWVWWAHIVNVWGAVLIAIVIHRYFGIRRLMLERIMLGYALVGTIVIPFLPLSATYTFGMVFATGSFAMVSYAVYCAAIGTLHGRQVDQVVLTAGIAAQIALAIHDWLLNLGLLRHQDWYLMHYGAPVLCFILTWLLTSRFVAALNVAEAAGEDLARQVEEKRCELEARYRQVEELQRQRAVAEERERIMRDLHDGLGGQLVSALAISQRADGAPAITQTLRDALEDLRMVIDSLDPVDGDLLVLLGTVRGRFESRLAQHGLRFEWQVSDIPAIPGFGPDQALQVLRIVQEAIANILKHADARSVTVRTGLASASEGRAASVFIEVEDDGKGFAGPREGGRGLRNMRERAARIGGTVDLDTCPGGTTVRLSLPLPQAA